jgi:hypothetical protein
MKRLSGIIKLFYRPKVYPTEYEHEEESKTGYTHKTHSPRTITDLSNIPNISGFTEHRYPADKTLMRFLEE